MQVNSDNAKTGDAILIITLAEFTITSGVAQLDGNTISGMQLQIAICK